MMFSPTPWHYENRGRCAIRDEDFGDIIGADGRSVAESVYRKDAAAIIKAVNPSPNAAPDMAAPHKEKS